MPSKQTSGSQMRKPQGARAESASARGAAQTGARDEHYDLISVLYHALQGAETVAQYVGDARSARDQELQSFFEETRTEYAELAQRAKQLLASRIEGMSSELEEDEEEDEDEDIEDEDADEDDED